MKNEQYEEAKFVRGVEDTQNHLWVESEANCDLSQDWSVDLEFKSDSRNELSVAGKAEDSLEYKYTLPGNQGTADCASTQILIVEDNTYSAYALMSVLQQYQIQF